MLAVKDLPATFRIKGKDIYQSVRSADQGNGYLVSGESHRCPALSAFQIVDIQGSASVLRISRRNGSIFRFPEAAERSRTVRGEGADCIRLISKQKLPESGFRDLREEGTFPAGKADVAGKGVQKNAVLRGEK